jgi:hypothetical protein
VCVRVVVGGWVGKLQQHGLRRLRAIGNGLKNLAVHWALWTPGGGALFVPGARILLLDREAMTLL